MSRKYISLFLLAFLAIAIFSCSAWASSSDKTSVTSSFIEYTIRPLGAVSQGEKNNDKEMYTREFLDIVSRQKAGDLSEEEASCLLFVLSERATKESLTDVGFYKGKNLSTGNKPPSKPELRSPYDKETGVSLTPTFSWSGSVDPEGDSFTYKIIVSGVDNDLLIYADDLTSTSYQFSEALLPGQEYRWFITATDKQGNFSRSGLFNFNTRG
ncbi:MAG: hypothetical protein EOM12_18080, partial [Verrucomicrobiae bacterium]|nr:hypothetical protein [Verrucomicrobiae bacterium]